MSTLRSFGRMPDNAAIHEHSTQNNHDEGCWSKDRDSGYNVGQGHYDEKISGPKKDDAL